MPARVENRSDLSLRAPLGALVLAVSLFAGTMLWASFGEAIYIERIFGAIAGCF